MRIKNIEKIKIGCSLFLLSLIAVFSGCGKTKDNVTGKDSMAICVVGNSMAYAPFYIAMNSDFQGGKLQWKILYVESDQEAVKCLADNSACVAVMGNGMATQEGFIKIAQLTQKPTACLITEKQKQSFSWEQFASEKISIQKNCGITDFLALGYIMERWEISLITDTKAAYQLAKEPMASVWAKQNQGEVAAYLGEYSGKLPCDCVCVKEDILEKEGEAVSELMQKLQLGMDYIYNHKTQDTAKLIASYYPDADKEMLSRIIDKYLAMEVWKPQIEPSEIQESILENVMEDVRGKMQ